MLRCIGSLHLADAADKADLHALGGTLERQLVAMNGPLAARNRLPLIPQLPTFWARLGRSEGDPQRTFYGNQFFG